MEFLTSPPQPKYLPHFIFSVSRNVTTIHPPSQGKPECHLWLPSLPHPLLAIYHQVLESTFRMYFEIIHKFTCYILSGTNSNYYLLMSVSFQISSLSPGLVAQLLGASSLPVHQKVAGSIPGQSTYLGCRFSPQLGHIQEAIDVSLSSSFSNQTYPQVRV